MPAEIAEVQAAFGEQIDGPAMHPHPHPQPSTQNTKDRESQQAQQQEQQQQQQAERTEMEVDEQPAVTAESGAPNDSTTTVADTAAGPAPASSSNQAAQTTNQLQVANENQTAGSPSTQQQTVDPAALQPAQPGSDGAAGSISLNSASDDAVAAASLGVNDIVTALQVVRDAEVAAQAAEAEQTAAPVLPPPPAQYDSSLELHGVPVTPLMDFLSHLHDPFKLLRVNTILKACKTPRSYHRVDKRPNEDYRPEAEAEHVRRQAEETAKAVRSLAQRGGMQPQEGQGEQAAEANEPNGQAEAVAGSSSAVAVENDAINGANDVGGNAATSADRTAAAAAAADPQESPAIPEELQRVPILKELRIDIETLHPSALYRLEEHRRAELGLPALEVTFVDYLDRKSLRPKTPEPIDYAAIEAEEKAREVKKVKCKAKGFTAALYGKEDEILIENGEVVRELPEDPELDAMPINEEDPNDGAYREPHYVASTRRERAAPRLLDYTPAGEYTIHVVIPYEPTALPRKKARPAGTTPRADYQPWRPGSKGRVPQWYKDQQASLRGSRGRMSTSSRARFQKSSSPEVQTRTRSSRRDKETPSSTRATRARGPVSSPEITEIKAPRLIKGLPSSTRSTRARAGVSSPRATRTRASQASPEMQEVSRPSRVTRAHAEPSSPKSTRKEVSSTTRTTRQQQKEPSPTPRMARRQAEVASPTKAQGEAPTAKRSTRATANVSPPKEQESSSTRRATFAKKPAAASPEASSRVSRSGLQRIEPTPTRANGRVKVEPPASEPEPRASRATKAPTPEQPRSKSPATKPSRNRSRANVKARPAAAADQEEEEDELDPDLDSEDGMHHVDEAPPSAKRQRKSAAANDKGKGKATGLPSARSGNGVGNDEVDELASDDEEEVSPEDDDDNDWCAFAKAFDRPPSKLIDMEPFEPVE